MKQRKYIEYLRTTDTSADVVVFNGDSEKFSYILLDGFLKFQFMAFAVSIE
jgi:hypothetical protein